MEQIWNKNLLPRRALLATRGSSLKSHAAATLLARNARGATATLAITSERGSWDPGEPALSARVEGDALVLDGSACFVQDAFKAELLDISTSGLAFLMKTTQKVSAMLLGRDLAMKLTFGELAKDLAIDCVGSVVAVNREPFHEYAVHVEFGKNLASSIIADLEDLINNPAEK